MVTTSERLNAAREFLAAMQAVETEIKEAQEVQRFLHDCAVLAEPILHERGSAIVEHGWWHKPHHGLREPVPLRIVPLFCDDGHISRDWARYVTMAASAFYVSGLHAIMIRPELLETPFVRGCALIHEGNHALRALRQQRYGGRSRSAVSDHQHFVEECEVTEIEGNLWRERGRAAFEDALTKGLEWLQAEMDKHQQQPGDAVFIIPFDDLAVKPILESFLGAAPEERALRNRFNLLNQLVHLRAIDASSLPRKARSKVAIMATFHSMANMPQRI